MDPWSEHRNPPRVETFRVAGYDEHCPPLSLPSGPMSFGTATSRPGFGFGFTLTPWVKRLLIANGVIYLLMLIVGRGFFWNWFGFTPAEVLTRPWGVVTYMFIHGDFWHVLLNMLVLFFFGPPLESRWGSNEFLKYYLLCGLGGAALSFLFAPTAGVIGASAAVYGVMLAFAWYWPDSPIYIWGIFPVKAKWMVAFLFILTFISAFGGAGGGVAHFAHLGGLAAGALYLRVGAPDAAGGSFLRKSGRGQRMAIVPRKEEEEEGRSRRVVRRSRGKDGLPDEELLDEVDRILDKISASGMASLSDEERQVLDEVSRRRRSN
jgi:membrane associated rhomboid family serine protease